MSQGPVNLPTLQAFNQDGTYKEKAALEAIATAVVGKDASREIITVCDSGEVALSLGIRSVRSHGIQKREGLRRFNGRLVERPCGANRAVTILSTPVRNMTIRETTSLPDLVFLVLHHQ